MAWGLENKFNEVMLAKQAWRLTHDMPYFFNKVFKAKYFSSGTIFDAKVKSGSYTWKSILKAQKFINTRAKWNIGNGCLTQIYHDNWLPSDDYGRVVSLPTLLPTGASVDLLVDEDLRW